jgi:micrococcal nuclease
LEKAAPTNDTTKESADTGNDLSEQSNTPQKVELNENKKLLDATIIKNIDGDAVEINLNGKDEKIRMLCVDTPETRHPRLGVQTF